MRPFFIFNGRDSREFGIVVEYLPPIVAAGKRYSRVEIDGIDGDIIEEFGYESFDETIAIGLTGSDMIDDIIGWLHGSGSMILSTEPDKFRKVTILEKLSFERLVKFRRALVTVHFQPGKYLVNEKSVSTTGQNLTVINKGNRESCPMIRLAGSGIVGFFQNGIQIFRIELKEGEPVVIDSEAQEAFVPDTLALRNRKMTGEFPVLSPGKNEITVDPGVTFLEIEPRSRWR